MYAWDIVKDGIIKALSEMNETVADYDIFQVADIKKNITIEITHKITKRCIKIKVSEYEYFKINMGSWLYEAIKEKTKGFVEFYREKDMFVVL